MNLLEELLDAEKNDPTFPEPVGYITADEQNERIKEAIAIKELIDTLTDSDCATLLKERFKEGLALTEDVIDQSDWQDDEHITRITMYPMSDNSPRCTTAVALVDTNCDNHIYFIETSKEEIEEFKTRPVNSGNV